MFEFRAIIAAKTSGGNLCEIDIFDLYFFFSTKTSSDVQFCMLYILVVTCMYFFQIVWKSRCHILGTFPSHLKRNMFYTEILTQKFELWIVSFRNRAIVQFDKNLGIFFS